MRQIDADGLIVKINDYFDKCEKRGITPTTFGVNRQIKAMPTIDLWKYPSKGEYPPNSKWVFVYLNDNTATVGLYCSWAELKWIDTYENEIYNEDIVAWQYIIPPKERAE